jgi:hypothetical protein
MILQKPFNLLLFIVLISLIPVSQAQNVPLYVFGGQGHKEFLGCFNCGEMHAKSVWNEMSNFGFKNDFGIWNNFGPYASEFSSDSMCSEFATNPPVIVDEKGNSYGRLSTNEFVNGGVCGISGNVRTCRVVRIICTGKK